MCVRACQLHKSHRDDIRLLRGASNYLPDKSVPRARRTHVYDRLGLLRRCATVNCGATAFRDGLHISRFTACRGRNINSILNKYTMPYINSCLVFALFCISSARPSSMRSIRAPMIYSETWIRSRSVYLPLKRNRERGNSLSDVKSHVLS